MKEKDTGPEANQEDLWRDAARHHWLQDHYGADQAVDDLSRIMVKGDGIHLFDVQGKRYVDAIAGLFLMNIGHGQEEVADAVSRQLKKLAYVNSGAYSTLPATELSRKLAEITPGDLSRIFFCGGGSEAVEIALKMARQYHHLRGRPNKSKIIARRGQYHGSTYAAMSLTGPARFRGIFEPHDPQARHVERPYCYRCPWELEYDGGACDLQCVKDLERLIKFEGAETIAAFIATPVSAGNQVPPPEYWSRVRDILQENEILFIDDEVLCGFGRLGTWFGIEHFDIEPDIVTMAKALTGGYIPGGAVAASEEIAEAFADDTFHHGVTYAGHTATMVSALKSIEIMERESIVQNAAEMGGYLHRRAMEVLYEKHPTVGYIGSLGLLMGIEMVQDRETKKQWAKGRDHPYAQALTAKLRDRGLAIRAGNLIVLSPPLTIDRAAIDEIIDILDESITEMEEKPKWRTR